MPRQHRRQEEWLTLIADFEQSNQTQTAFCAERGLNPKYFSLKRSQLTPSTKTAAGSTAGFVKVTGLSAEGIRLRVGAVCIELPSNFSLDTLSRLILTLA